MNEEENEKKNNPGALKELDVLIRDVRLVSDWIEISVSAANQRTEYTSQSL